MAENTKSTDAGGLAKLIPILKKWGPRIILASIAGVIAVALIGKIPSWGGHGDEWVTVTRATCSPTWNNDRGWCTVVKDAAKGTYRIIPRYKSWELWQNDNTYITVPPHGLDIYAHWKEHEGFIDEFHRTAHKKGGNNYGALAVRIGNMDIIEALNSSRAPREFEVAKDGTEIAITVNIMPTSGFWQHNRGGLSVEVQRLD
ncbi:MAG: hypothetical protein WAW00_00835 [Candidatus Moraniibacteriota bacterium]